jgi:TonB dependent receptor-like, beta-barrel
VIETDSVRGLVVRGSDPGATSVYIDGALIRNGQRGEADLELGTNGIARASLTTGALAADVGGAEGGAISFTTPGGSPAWRGAARYRTDDLGVGAWGSVGLHRVEASVGGPVAGHLTVFGAATLTGRQSLETQKYRDAQAPVYVIAGADTLVHQPDTWGAALTDTAAVAIPRFAQYSGGCDVGQNFGLGCQGLQVPFTANGSYTAQAQLREAYGRGSSVALTALASRSQQRDFPGASLYDPTDYTATTTSSRAAIATWRQRLAPSLALEAGLSYQRDDRVSGALTRGSELDSRDPFGGFLLNRLHYLVDLSSTHPVTIAGSSYGTVGYLDGPQITCIQAGEGSCRDDVPFLNDNDFNLVQPYRLNPYAVEQGNLLPLWTGGTRSAIDLSRESRRDARARLEWRAGHGHRITAGGELRGFETARYDVPYGPTSSFDLNAYRERPLEQGAFLEDRIEFGDALLVAGLRWDRFDSRAGYPETPGRIVTGSGPFDPADPTASFVPAVPHGVLSPRLQFRYALDRHSSIRFSYGRQVQVPPFDLLFLHKNLDLSEADRSVVFGRGIGFTQTLIAELGVRHEFGDRTLLDVAGYDKGLRAQPVERLVLLPDPQQLGMPADFWVVATADLGWVQGVDVRLEHRVSDVFAAAVAYSYEHATVIDSRQALAGSVRLTVPDGWHAGTPLGALLADAGAFATFRLTNGQRYTTVQDQGLGYTVSDPGGLLAEPPGTSRLPWTKTLDLRVTRGFHLPHLTGRLFVESTNLLNLTNVLDRFLETNGVLNPGYRQRFVNEQVSLLRSEASNAGLLTTDASGRPAVDLSAAGVCTGWQGENSGNFASGPVDCVLLQRAEQRFGNGDGVYTEAEYTRAFGAWYDLLNAPYGFYGPGRRIRVGMEFVF